MSDARVRLARYIIGDLDRAAREEIERWVAANPRHAELLREMRAVWAAIPQQPSRYPAVDVALAQSAVLARIDSPEPRRVVGQIGEAKSGEPRRVTGRGLRARTDAAPSRFHYAFTALVAAAAIAFAVVGLRVRPPARHLAAAPLTYTTDPGQRATITLPDGSVVMLNVASRLEVPSDFSDGNHVLRLQGEASFDVRHQDRTPFSVIAGPITTRVLGTRFVVRHYATDAASTVAVRDGKVSVRDSAAGPLVLTSAQQVEFTADGTVRLMPADADAFGFETGMLTIKHMRLRDAIPELNRWYDADIRLGDPSLGNQFLTSRLASGSLTDLATMLELTFDVRVSRNNRVFTLYRR